MKRIIFCLVVCGFSFVSCGGAKTQTPEEAALEFCDLMTRTAAATGDESIKLMQELEELETKIESEHQEDVEWQKAFEAKVESTCIE